MPLLLHVLTNTVFKYLACLLVAPVLMAQGCAPQRVIVTYRPAPLAEHVRAELGTIGVLPGRLAARSNYEQHEPMASLGPGDNTSGGAIAGAAVGSTGAAALLPFAIIFPPMLIVAGGVFLAATAGGAVVGASREAPSPDHAGAVTEAKRAMGDALALERAQADLHQRLMTAAQGLASFDLVSLEEGELSVHGGAVDLQVFAEGGFESLLLANVDEVTVSAEEGPNPVLAIDVVVTSTLLSAGRGGPIDERTFTCRAGKRPARAWRVNGLRSLRDAVARCYDKVAARIIEELFLVHVEPDGSMSGFGGRAFTRVDLEGGRPRFTWAPLPVGDRRGAAPEDERIRLQGVTYDLRIWRAEDGFPGELVYQREALPEPSHTLEYPLAPSTLYFWTVRARFQLNGRTRVTPWAVTQERHGYSPDRLDRVTNDFYYRFTTPPPPDAIVPAAR